MDRLNNLDLTSDEKNEVKLLVLSGEIDPDKFGYFSDDNELREILLKKISNKTPQKAQVDQPVSPRFFESCFVIVDGLNVVAGSAFAVSPSLLISAMHVFEDDVDFFACQDINRNTTENTVSYPEGKYKVKIVAKGNANVDSLDFVVLQLSDPSVKLPKYLPIATQVEKGEHVRLYSAYNAPGFNEFTQDFCNIAIDTVQLISTISGSHIYCSKGSENGNSGGPYINRRGEVVAIHTVASSNIPDIEKFAVNTTTKKAKLLVADVDVKVANVTAKVVELCDVVSRISNTHTSHSIGLVIKNCPELCAFLRQNEVNV